MNHCCFKQGCKHEIQYICLCLSSQTYCGDFHLEAHLKLPNRTHFFDSILLKLHEWTKDAILEYLTKEKSKKEKLKEIVLGLIGQDAYKSNKSFVEKLRQFDTDLQEINSLIEKVWKIPEQMQLLNTSIPQPNTKEDKTIISKDSDLYNDIKSFYRLNKLRNSTSLIRSKINNDRKTEQYFRKICTKYANYASSPLFKQAYQVLINAYQMLTSNHFIRNSNFEDDVSVFGIYNTETETEIEKVIPYPYINSNEHWENSQYWNNEGCIVQLPDGEIFWLNGYKKFATALIIDKNFGWRNLPHEIPFNCTNAVYFNRSIYCFGCGKKIKKFDSITDAIKFDLDENRWFYLTRIPIAESYCNIVTFNDNILISRAKTTILVYSIDIDSYSEIPYKFSMENEKTLVKAEKSLYLIESIGGYIYKNEAGDEYAWTKIADSRFVELITQVDCSYNKRGIYISNLWGTKRSYFKLDLDNEVLIETAYYSEALGESLKLRKVEDEFGEIKIEYNTWSFKVDPDQYASYLNEGYILRDLYDQLTNIQLRPKHGESFSLDDAIYPFNIFNLTNLELDHHQAIEYFNKVLILNPNDHNAYFRKGYALFQLNEVKEALDCCHKAIELNPGNFLYEYYYDLFDHLKKYRL